MQDFIGPWAAPARLPTCSHNVTGKNASKTTLLLENAAAANHAATKNTPAVNQYGNIPTFGSLPSSSFPVSVVAG